MSRLEYNPRAWQDRIDIGDLHTAYRAKRMKIQDVGVQVAARLEKTRWAEALAADIRAFRRVRTEDRYNALLEALYDFGDRGKRLWIGSE